MFRPTESGNLSPGPNCPPSDMELSTLSRAQTSIGSEIFLQDGLVIHVEHRFYVESNIEP